MALLRVTLRLNELRCLAQSESSGSEPYLWTTFFALGAVERPFQTGLVGIDTPITNRSDFPNQMKAGQVARVPGNIGVAHFDMDFDVTVIPKMIGCIVVLLEQDDTADSSILLGRIAYAEEIKVQLNALFEKRFETQDTGPLTAMEIKVIKDAVRSKVLDAVKSDQSWWDLLLKDQDDIIGFVFKVFQHPAPAGQPEDDIKSQNFSFPEITSGSSNRFSLSGQLSLGPVPRPPIDPCAAEVAALRAKTDHIAGLNNLIASLQAQLTHASPAQKAAIIANIRYTQTLITEAEAQIPALQAELNACRARHPTDTIDPTI